MNKRIEKTLNIWKQFVSKELEKTINYLEKNLIEVDFIIHNNNFYNTFNDEIGYFILYTIKQDENSINYKSKKYDFTCFEGNLNFDFEENNILKQNWDKIPKSIVNFYKNVHNGFSYYLVPCGIEELSNVMAFGDYYCEEDFEEYKGKPDFNIATTFEFFHDGRGGLVIIDTNKNNIEEEAICWYPDDIEMSYIVNFWEKLDEWLVWLMTN